MESSPVTFRDGRLLLHPVMKKDDEGTVVGIDSYREEWAGWDKTLRSPAFLPSEPGSHTTLQRKLAGMNDMGRSFEEIASWVEANL